jgi:hypothetical protein
MKICSSEIFLNTAAIIILIWVISTENTEMNIIPMKPAATLEVQANLC